MGKREEGDVEGLKRKKCAHGPSRCRQRYGREWRGGREGGKGGGPLHLFSGDIYTYFYHVVIPCEWGKSGHVAKDGPLVVCPYPSLFRFRMSQTHLSIESLGTI